jgi:hypothetical protein
VKQCAHIPIFARQDITPATTSDRNWICCVATFVKLRFSNNGPFTEDGNRYAGQVEGNKLTFTGPARFQYALAEDGSITVYWWLRDEQGTWQRWMINRFIKRR